MVQQPLVECRFFIPMLRDKNLSDGAPHRAEEWDWLDEELFGRFQGRTIAPGLYEGFYKDPDTQERVNDQSRQYLIAVPAASIDSLRELLVQACVKFQQKCIYLSVAGQVEFIEGRDHETNGSVH